MTSVNWWSSTRRITLSAALAAAVVGLLAPVPSAAPALKRLNGIGELKAWFNAGAGHPRLIFLLSPT
jgi:hypothetical protein